MVVPSTEARCPFYSCSGSPSRSFLAGRDTTCNGGNAYAHPPTSRGLGPQGTAPPSMAASWGRLVMSPLSCSVGMVFFHKEGRLGQGFGKRSCQPRFIHENDMSCPWCSVARVCPRQRAQACARHRHMACLLLRGGSSGEKRRARGRAPLQRRASRVPLERPASCWRYPKRSDGLTRGEFLPKMP